MMNRPLGFFLCLLLLFSTAVHALHFYLDANEKRCFVEELPTDTVVEGEHLHFMVRGRPSDLTVGK